MAQLCTYEGSLGPIAYCRHMDFTLGFELRFLSIAPSAFFIFYAILRLKFLLDSQRVVKSTVDVLSATKLALGLVLVASTAALVGSVPRNGWGLWATIAYSLELIVALCFVPVSYIHHTRTIAPSVFIGSYLALQTLFTAAQLRTYITTGLFTASFFPPLVIAFAARTILVVVEFTNKRHWLLESCTPAAAEATASLPERLSFAYLWPLLLRGFKGPISLDQLNDFGLPYTLSSSYANARLTKTLAEARTVADVITQPIFLPSMKAFFSQFAGPAIPKLFLIATTFTQPFLVSRMLSFIESYSSDDGAREDPALGWGLVGAYAIVYMLIAFSTALYWDKVYAMVVCYRAALVSVIFDKSMRLSASVSETKGNTAVTYMSVDVERVCEGIAFFHETWSALLSIAVAAVILWFRATFAMIPPIVIMIGFFFITSYIGKRVAGSQKRWMESTQARIKVLTSITSQMLPIKFLAVEQTVRKWVEPVREREVSQLRGFYFRLVIVGVLSSATINFAGLSALGTFVGISSDNLRPQNLFTILTVVNLVTLPISTVGNCFPLLLASYASMKRIAEFLSLEEKTEIISDEANSDLSVTEVGSTKSASSATSLKKVDRLDGPLSLDNVTVAVDARGQPVLSDLSITIPERALTMIVGPVASGKTVLLRTLLGENFIMRGGCSLPNGRVAYAPQEAFIWPTTIRENIVLDGDFDPDWYADVVKACALEHDFSEMADGDMTVMTSGAGSSVSGGQKQRISLARAVYARCAITLLDDCFSALDAHTSAAVFENLFGREGIFRGRCVALVTHNLLHLSVAEHVIILDACAVVAEGSLQDIRAGNLDVAKYVGEQKSVDEVEVVATSNRPVIKPAATTVKAQVSEKKAAPVTGSPETKPASPKANKWAPYLFYLRACGWKRLSLCFGCLVTYTAMQIGLQVLLKYWSESTTTSHGPWLGGYAAFTVICFITSFITLGIYSQYTAPHASLVIHAHQLATVLAAPVTYFQKTPVAQLQNRWSSDMYIADFAFPRAIQDFMFTAVYVVGAIVLILIAVPWLAISIPFLAVIYWGLQRIYLATSRQLQALTMSSKTPIYTAFTSTLNGLVTIRAFQAQKLFKTQSIHHLDRAQTPMYYRYAGIRFLRTSLNCLTAFIAIAIAALAVGLRNNTSGGYLGVALSQLVGLSQSLINLLLAYTRVENGIVSVARILELDTLEAESDENTDTSNFGQQWPSTGHVEFRDVSLRYSLDGAPVLKNLSFTVRGGEKLGICGRTGSGKSSTIFTLLRGPGKSFMSGKIFIDGVDITTVPLSVLRSAISTVSQDPFLLYASLRDNLTLGCATSVTDQEIWEALKLSNMGNAVNKLEKKLDTIVAGDGSQFSAGERQLLCIARVLLQKRKIVVLDEASSSMDTGTDKQLLEVLNTALRDVTVISVAHRISTIVAYDNVMVLDSGRILETGAPRELLTHEDSHFAGLYKAQTA
ncbi:P-loop containing nucleoside triphosphate hydrolase protein [Cylindrobasidium torrendii FP15055 ss-10]|uniref:p-loop containing nucleoside triphosphate hydrolase protein n=1 Tax=Cylindrobasidium torrendii FP15055 ss-10 TaxID=1314674 RepID=A0A0D7BSF9_9AGAR|nr:P-loop containing nucleoside triphosphate hydrolase protein [Cylindrobasidium torrendii FP15055 ss-10]